MILDAVSRLLPRPRRISGKCIENLIPEGAPDKGVALAFLMLQAGCPNAFLLEMMKQMRICSACITKTFSLSVWAGAREVGRNTI